MQFLKNLATHLQGGNAQTVLLMVPTHAWTHKQKQCCRASTATGKECRECANSHETVELGPMGKPRWAQDKGCTFEAFCWRSKREDASCTS